MVHSEGEVATTREAILELVIVLLMLLKGQIRVLEKARVLAKRLEAKSNRRILVLGIVALRLLVFLLLRLLLAEKLSVGFARLDHVAAIA